jgi:hypothetical protein
MDCSSSGAALLAFSRLPRGRPQAREWTVLAAFTAAPAGALASPPARHRALCLATGSKCLGARDRSRAGLRVADGHAEALARRALKLRLLREVARHIAAGCALRAGGDGG